MGRRRRHTKLVKPNPTAGSAVSGPAATAGRALGEMPGDQRRYLGGMGTREVVIAADDDVQT